MKWVKRCGSMEETIQVQFLGTRRSRYLDDEEKFEATFSVATMDTDLEIENIYDLMFFLSERANESGDVIKEITTDDGELIIFSFLCGLTRENNLRDPMELYEKVVMMYGFGNMDPADFIGEFWHDVESAVYPD